MNDRDMTFKCLDILDDIKSEKICPSLIQKRLSLCVCVCCFALVNDVRWNEAINYGFGCLISFLMTFFTVSESVLVSRVLCGSFAFSTHDSQPLTLLATLYFQPHNYRAHRNTFSRGVVCISHANRDT